MGIDEIIVAVQRLEASTSELEELRSTIDALLVEKRRRRGPSQSARLLYECVARVARAKGINMPPNLDMMKTRTGFQEFTQGAEQLAAYTSRVFGKLSNLDKRKVYSMYARLLVKRVETIGLPITFATLARQAQHIPALMNNAFPGYVENGLMKRMLLGAD